MQAHEYPQLPTPGPGYPPVPQQYAYMPGQPLPPLGVPPTPPSGRSAGFWAAATAAIALAVVIALLSGFFIGRGSRISNEDIQSKLVQQSQLDQLAQQRALNDQRTALDRQRNTALARARSTARASGLREGRLTGVQQGRDSGVAEGQSIGYNQGYNDGYQAGLSTSSTCFGIDSC